MSIAVSLYIEYTAFFNFDNKKNHDTGFSAGCPKEYVLLFKKLAFWTLSVYTGNT